MEASRGTLRSLPLGRRKRYSSRFVLRRQAKRVRGRRSRPSRRAKTTLERFHGDASDAPPTNQWAVTKRKRKRESEREKTKKKMRLLALTEPFEDREENGTETDEYGLETVPGMEAWHEMGLPLVIIRALKDLGFTSPTEIQSKTIPVAMDTTRDIIGAAETGSGKTLAFSLPILNYIIANDPRARKPSVKGGDVMATSLKRRKHEKSSLLETKIIDLNVVLHSEDGEEDEKELEKIDTEDDLKVEFDAEKEEKIEVDAEEDDEKGEDDEQRECGVLEAEIESESSSDDDGNEGVHVGEKGLVFSLDNIPEDEFMKMISDSGSTSDFRSHDPHSESHDFQPDDVTIKNDKSHDLCDVMGRSCDLSHDRGLLALILTPTRELALQIKHHITAAAKYTSIEVCVVVGGMSDAKQERLLSRHPPIVVATPGRLWKLMSDGHLYLTGLDSVRFLVLDEADRMIEFGHYQEVTRILDRLNRVNEGVGLGVELGGKQPRRWQTFVFSATLSLPRKSNERKVKVRQRKNMTGQESIDNLISQVGLREDVAVIDIARETGTTETLSEVKIMCSSEEKLVYLYYFLLLYPGRSLVFVNSISTLQRLRSLLELLLLKPLPLHARMQQRQRLKNFDRFATCSESVLLASDVAARGLDFPCVHHVIHYDVPLNSELYIHRSGRTARQHREGLSLLLVGPQDMTSYKNICKALKRDGLPSFPMDDGHLKAVRQQVSVARRLETAMHRRKKRKRDSDWLKSTAQALELEYDADWHGMETSDTGLWESDREESLKHELSELLKVPIIPHSVSTSYPTHDQSHKLLKNLSACHRRGRQIITTETKDALKVARRKNSNT